MSPNRRLSENVQDRLACVTSPGEGSIFSHLRSPIDIRHPAQRRRRCRRVGHAIAPAGRCEGFQEILADEAADETRGIGETEPPSQRRRSGFWHSTGPIRSGFWHSFGTVEAKEERKRWNADHLTLLESAGGLVGAGRFERPTPCAQGRCATRLRYAPTFAVLFILKYFPAFSKLVIRYFRFPFGQTVSKLYQNPFSLACLYQDSCPVRWPAY